MNKLELLNEVRNQEIHKLYYYSEDSSLNKAKVGCFDQWEQSKENLKVIDEIIKDIKKIEMGEFKEVMLDVKKHEGEIELLIPRTIKDLKHILKGIDIELDDLLYGTSVVENIETGVPYLDKLIEEYREVNLNELNYLSYVICHFDNEQKEKFSAVLQFEDDNNNIKSLKDVIQVTLSLDEYRFQEGVKDLDDYVKAITIGHEEEYSKLKITDIDHILKTMNDFAKGKYLEYDDKNYFVGYNTLDKITRRQRIKTYRLRDFSILLEKNNINENEVESEDEFDGGE